LKRGTFLACRFSCRSSEIFLWFASGLRPTGGEPVSAGGFAFGPPRKRGRHRPPSYGAEAGAPFRIQTLLNEPGLILFKDRTDASFYIVN
jgi:hypothetical protein